MSESKTGCECPLAGFCNRHNMQKTPHMHKLCQNHQGYFDKWEKCQGPGQDQSQCSKEKTETTVEVKPQEIKKPVELPSIVQQAKNFAVAATNHAKNGFKSASEEVQNERLSICGGCEYYIAEQHRCGKCGCPLAGKTKWASSTCPIGKW